MHFYRSFRYFRCCRGCVRNDGETPWLWWCWLPFGCEVDLPQNNAQRDRPEFLVHFLLPSIDRDFSFDFKFLFFFWCCGWFDNYKGGKFLIDQENSERCAGECEQLPQAAKLKKPDKNLKRLEIDRVMHIKWNIQGWCMSLENNPNKICLACWLIYQINMFLAVPMIVSSSPKYRM